MKTDEIREAYLSFFESKGCVRKPSDVLVPRDDKTVLFTPAGMNQFKREFMGLGDPTFKRATTCQKCLRTGDIDNVGRTSFHETFFEMLGNFSFGDYFKREAIHWAWEFLTKALSIKPERLTVTVYLTDDEAFNIWHKEIGLPTSRIERKDEDENFWPASAPSQGPDGVCGPCSEIYYHGNGPKEVEIWNLVFTQFNRVGPNQLEPLPSKNIDTGMGLERAAACLQGTPTVFGTDIFQPIVAAVAETLGVKYDAEGPDGVRVRRMADHSRALTFCIHENVFPGAEKQGYVVRRLLRRAVLDAYQMGRRDPFLGEIVPVVADVMKVPYPELAESIGKVQGVIKEEEEKFLQNLEGGLRLMSDVFRRTKAGGSKVISGKDAHDLHSTHGIPVEVVASLADEQQLEIEQEGFEKAQKEHADISRPQTGAAAVFEVGPLDQLKKQHQSGTTFLGYETTSAKGAVVAIVQGSQLIEEATPEIGPVAVILDQTPFYGESGGQIGDLGSLSANGAAFAVSDAQKKNDFILHLGTVTSGKVRVGDSLQAEVDAGRRQAIRRAHSATHVLHHALQQALGSHAQQAGSKVEPDRLRFDFANKESVPRETLKAIEARVNELVLQGDPITWSYMPLAEARTLGAMALFGEKYPETVRVVRMGDFSRELCGGTHLDHVGQVGLFKVIGEESVASGTRRIVALTGQAALDHVRQQEEALSSVASALKVPVGQAADRVTALLDEVKSLKKQASQKKAEAAPKVTPDQLLADADKVGEIAVVSRAIEGGTPDELRQLADVLRRKAGENLAVLLASAHEGKVQLIAALTDNLVKSGLHAGNWLKEVAPIVGGGGGGRPDMAQAGGKAPDKLPEALKAAVQSIRSKVQR